MSTLFGPKVELGNGYDGVGTGIIGYNNNNGNNVLNDEEAKKKIDIFNPNASTAGYNQVSAWTTA
jgi:hypothetical protein